MPLSANLLLTATALCCFAMFALPIDAFSKDNQCRCLTTTDKYMNPRSFQRFEIIPSSPRCSNTEIIITLKDNRGVCVDPEAVWVQQFISRVLKKKGLKM